MHKKVHALIVMLLVCFAFSQGVGQANSSIPVKKIGVLELENSTNFRDYGQVSSDAIISDLVQLRSCDVVERVRLKQVIAEQALGERGLLDQNAVSKVGGILGIDYILMGSVAGGVTKEPGHYEYDKKRQTNKWINGSARSDISLTLKLVDVKNGQIVWSDQATGTSYNEDINEALMEAVYDTLRNIYKFIPIQGYVIKTEGERFIIDLGKVNNIDKGDNLIVMGTGEVIRHPVTGELIVNQKKVASLQVTEVFDNLCVAVPKIEKDGQKLLWGSVKPGDVVTRQLRKKPSGFLGVNWSGKRNY